jgi:hypothetical protein
MVRSKGSRVQKLGASSDTAPMVGYVAGDTDPRSMLFHREADQDRFIFGDIASGFNKLESASQATDGRVDEGGGHVAT